ncbi:MAG: DUF3857 domain-containing protein [Lysobacteraceae bacterium]
MLLRLALALLLAALPLATPAAEDRWFAEVPAWVEEQPLPEAGTDGNDNDRQQLLRSYQISLVDPQPLFYSRWATRVLAPSATADVASFSINYAPEFETPYLYFARVIRDGVVLDRLQSARIEDLRREGDLESRLIDGRRTLHVILDDVRVGDVVDVAVGVKGANPALGGRFSSGYAIDSPLPLGRRFIRLLRPNDRDVTAVVRNDAGNTALPQLEHRRWLDGGAVIEQWSADNLPARVDDAVVPGSFIEGIWLEIADAGEWRDIVEWALPMYRMQPDPAVARLAVELSGGAETLEDKVLAAIRFVQDDIRYTGLEFGENAFRPHAPGEVLQRRFGDCKDKTLLLVSLLAELGVEASPALVSSWRGNRLREDLPSATAFNHVIVRINVDGKEYWIDPTADQERGRLDQHTQSRLRVALPITQDSDALVDIPSEAPSRPTIDISEELDLRNTDGGEGSEAVAAADYRVRTTYRGSQADSVRRNFAGSGAQEVGKRYLQAVSAYYPGAEQVALPAITDDVDRNVVEVTEHYRLPELWQPVSDEAGARRAELWFTEVDRGLPDTSQSSRSAPFPLTSPFWVRQSLEIQLSPGWTPMTSSDKVVGEHAAFDARFKLTGDHARMVANYRHLSDEVPLADYADFRRDNQTINDNLGYTLTEREGMAAAAGAVDWAKWMDWRLSALLLLAVLPWMWLIIAALTRSLSPWLGMLTRPRQCMQAINGEGSSPAIVTLFALAGMWSLIWNDRFLQRVVREEYSSFGVILLALMAGALFLVPVTALLSALLGVVGNWLGGVARTRQVLTAGAWSNVPSILALPASLFALYAYGPQAMLMESFEGDGFAVSMIILAALLLCIPLWLWSLAVWVIALAEVQRFSIWRSLGSIALWLLGIGVVIFTAAFIWALLKGVVG